VKVDRQKVRDLLPEIALIKREELRDSVAATWADAMDEGGWSIEDLPSIPFTLLIPGCKFDIVHHTRAVTKTAVAIAETLKASYGDSIALDMDLLVAGALLHDVGKLLEYTREGKKVVKSRKGDLLRHPLSGQALAYKHGLPFEVLNMIAYHAKEGEFGKRTVEGIIIHHSDFVNFEPLKA
jgi:putative nucleotidyltransferase with HDIG domain